MSTGIQVLADSTVKNGSIRGFDLGYVVDTDAVHYPEHVWLSRLVFLENGDAIYNRSSDVTFTLTDSVLSGNGVGMGSEQDASRGAFEVRSSFFINNRLALTANSHTVDVSHSTFTRNDSVIWCPDGSVTFGSSVILQNKVRGNGGGLTLAEPAEFLVPTLTGTISGNRFQRNRGTGLLVTTASTLTVARNTAIDNTGWGIFAPGVIDGGGNVARGNAAGNCLGVACSSHLTAETPLLSEEEAPGTIKPLR